MPGYLFSAIRYAILYDEFNVYDRCQNTVVANDTSHFLMLKLSRAIVKRQERYFNKAMIAFATCHISKNR